MMSDIITSCLQLQKNISTNRIVVKEINGCDGSFIVNCVISYCIKQNSPLLIVSSHNSITHYHNVGLRMNHNLFKSCEAGVIHYFDFGDATLTNIMEYAESDQLLIDVLKNIEEMQRNHDTVNIIFDGITHLLDLQYTLQEVNKFCSEIIEIAAKSKNPFVIFHCNDVIEDDANHCLANLLSHKAQTVVEVENLSSGLSSDVSGHLTIKYPGNKFNEEHIHTVDMKPKKYLFKLFDRGVKLLAPGTV
ncbi:elongator complex protein 6-like isoform X3 [Bombyx mandarina]|uniref:Elongator complex protein 6 n=1 Tax=Bombyx mandarina TaxID=7092 RepID=A0A6J2KUY9_BOMMA|nr:elongator complex protein 6-like isoform X3 [Bombyx mandarina]